MLPASQTSPTRSVAPLGYRLVVFLTAMLMVYALLVGWGLIGGVIRYESAYLLIALACIAPIIAYVYGFLQARDGELDWGLLVSAIGWALVAIALLIQHGALQRQLGEIKNLPFGVVKGGLETWALLCSILAFCLIAGGAMLSLQSWNRERLAEQDASRAQTLRDNARRAGL